MNLQYAKWYNKRNIVLCINVFAVFYGLNRGLAHKDRWLLNDLFYVPPPGNMGTEVIKKRNWITEVFAKYQLYLLFITKLQII
jgi:hypothetical protein